MNERDRNETGSPTGDGDAGFHAPFAHDLSRGFTWHAADLVVIPVRGGVRLAERASGKTVSSLQGLEGHGWLSPLGDWLLIGGWGRVDAIDRSGTLRWTLRPRGAHVEEIAFRRGEARVTSVGEGGLLLMDVVDLETGLQVGKVD